ncbi:shufflon system plasmid conjugative transfer pilus tip adhesin PilV [Erwinia tasmaniensis]|nr:shufflon system plasmid conjugative transfer pilus tip adhesin PilV [Erwinia tasmaniensis]
MKRGIAQITDATVAYGIAIVIVVTLFIPLIVWAAEEYQLNVAAGQANTVQKAVNRYIADQQATIAAGSSPTRGFTLTVPMLVNAGYLPYGFSSTNAYTATYHTLIFQPAVNKFHTMTFLIDGAQLTLSLARKFANHIGAAGGYIENGVAKGAIGSWQENLSAFGGYNPGEGSVVIAGFYSNGALVNDYLYRHSVAGHPELNTMGTTLNMGSNDISSAKTIGTQTLNASADVNTARLTATQSIQSNDTINANGNITSRSSISASGNVTASGSMSASGSVTAGNDVTANGTLRAGQDAVIGGIMKLQQVNTAGTYCDTWGGVSRDSSGAVLSCQAGIWDWVPFSRDENGGIAFPNGLKIAWGTGAAVTLSQTNSLASGYGLYEGWVGVTPQFYINGKQISFSRVLNVQITPDDIGGEGASEMAWLGTIYPGSFSVGTSSRIQGATQRFHWSAIGY